VTRWEGNYDIYRRLRDQAEQSTRAQAAAVAAESRPAARPGAPSPQPAAQRRPGKLSFKDQRELEGMEALILAAEEKKSTLEATLGDPATYQKDGAAVAGLKADLDAATAEVERLYARWQELEALRGGGP
jgi:ATP-binding cassette subfamily F protein uup